MIKLKKCPNCEKETLILYYEEGSFEGYVNGEYEIEPFYIYHDYNCENCGKHYHLIFKDRECPAQF